jgi:hypothetical protein
MLETIEMELPRRRPANDRGSPASRLDPRVAYAEINNSSPNLAAYRPNLSDPSDPRAYLPL